MASVPREVVLEVEVRVRLFLHDYFEDKVQGGRVKKKKILEEINNRRIEEEVICLLIEESRKNKNVRL